MAYEPLHLKYRPQRFAEVVGQGAVVKTLANAIRLGRIAPAYLFCGPRGTGKTSSARILAKSLNCLQGPTADPCGICEQCRAITAGTALDVIEIDAASNTGVDNIRELIERAQFAPVSARYKVYVLDEVHMLSSAAFNSLLKTLEEPPPQVVFVLATTDPQRVLPTVISRCQRFDYRRIPLQDMAQHLGQIASQEGIAIAPEAIELIAQISQGGLRDAESLLDQLSLLEDEIRVEQVWDLVGAVSERDLLGLLDALYNQDPEQVLGQARRLLDHGKEPLVLLQNLTGFWRDLLLAKTAPDRRDLVALTQPTWDALRERAGRYTTARILAAQQHLRQSEPQVRGSSQPRLWLEIGLLGLLEVSNGSVPDPRQSVVPPPLGAKPSGSLPSQPPRSLAPIAPPPDPESKPAPAASLAALWEEFLERLPPLAKGRVRLGQVVQESQDEVILGFPSPGFADNARAKLSDISPLVESLLGRPIKLKFTVKAVTEAPAPPSPSAEDPPPKPRPALPKVEAPPEAPRYDADELQQAARLIKEHFNGELIDPGDEWEVAWPASVASSPPDSAEEEDLPF